MPRATGAAVAPRPHAVQKRVVWPHPRIEGFGKLRRYIHHPDFFAAGPRLLVTFVVSALVGGVKTPTVASFSAPENPAAPQPAEIFVFGCPGIVGLGTADAQPTGSPPLASA